MYIEFETYNEPSIPISVPLCEIILFANSVPELEAIGI